MNKFKLFYKIKDFFKYNFYKVQLENPIKNSKEDLIGVETEVKRLKRAIIQGANNIAVVSNYGSGKSTLIELLKRKLSIFKFKVVKINLWDNQLSEIKHNSDVSNIQITEEKNQEKIADDKDTTSQINNSIEENQELPLPSSTIKLHKSFLRQLAMHIKKYKIEYINKRLNLNYGVAKISFPNYRVLIGWILSYLIIFVGILFLITKYFLEINILEDLIYDDKIKLIEKCIELFPVFVITFIVIFIIFNREVLFSFWNSSKNREITEEDTFQLYNELVTSFPFRFRRLVIVVEDLDRINNSNLVTHYINEFYRIYIEGNNKKNKNLITFIFCVKNEYLYKTKEDNNLNFSKNESKFIKMFDYICNLPTIYIDDYEQVLKQLIYNDKFLRVKVELAQIKIEDLEWLIKGKDLNIRIIKNRLEMFKSIFLRLYNKEKEISNREKIDINNKMCAFVAFAHSEYPLQLHNILETYDNNNQNYIDRQVETFLTKGNLLKILSNDIDKELKNYIIELINSNILDDDYRKYFYNIPKGVTIFTTSQKKLSSYIFDIYMPNINDFNEFDLLINRSNTNSFIYNQFLRRINLGRGLTNIVFLNNLLFEVANHFPEELEKIAQNAFVFKGDNIELICTLFKEINKSNLDKKIFAEFIKPYVETSLKYILDNDLDFNVYKKYRMGLIECLGSELKEISNIFEDCPLDEDEINKIYDINTLIILCKFILPEYQETHFINRFNKIMLKEKLLASTILLIKEYKSFNLLLKVKSLKDLSLQEKKILYGIAIKELNISSINEKLEILMHLNLYDENINKTLISQLNKNNELNKLYVKYLNQVEYFSMESILYLLSTNKIYKLNKKGYAEIEKVDTNKYLLYKSYSENALQTDLINNHELLFDAFVNYNELTDLIKNNYDVKVLLLNEKIFKKLNNKNDIKTKIMIFSDCMQDLDIIKFILNNRCLSDVDKSKYLSNIKSMNLKASKYIYDYCNKSRDEISFVIKNAIYENAKILFENLETNEKRAIKIKLYNDIRENAEE